MSRIRYRSVKSAASGKSGPRLALVGCGAIAERYYLPALARYPSVMRSLVLVDRNEERARELAGRFGVKNCIGDYREILNEVDGAIVAVPTHLHFPIGVDFLGRGVHLLCEKPLAETSSLAREMVEQAAKAGATLAANYQCRLYRNLQKVRELLVNGTLGEPLSIEYHVGVKFDWPSVSGFYFNGDLSSRGVLRDQGAHVLDVICWWLGRKPELVSSHNDSFGGSEAVAHVRFKQGRCVGEVKLSWLGKSGSRFVVRCEAGKVEPARRAGAVSERRRVLRAELWVGRGSFRPEMGRGRHVEPGGVLLGPRVLLPGAAGARP